MRKLMACLVALVATSAANAGLIGSTVNVSAYYPNNTTVYSNPGNQLVTLGVEYPAGSFTGYPPIQIDVGDNHITVTYVGTGMTPFAAAAFNGFILKVISGPTILGATLDPSSTLIPSSVSLSGGQVLLNFQGVSPPAPTGPRFTRVNLVTSNDVVPEPFSLVVFGGLVVGGGLVARKRLLAKKLAA